MLRVWCSPTNWHTRLAAIPNDGKDVEVLFESGIYDAIAMLGDTTGASWHSISVNKSNGGLLYMRPATPSATPYFSIPQKRGLYGMARQNYLSFRSTGRVWISGIQLLGHPYYSMNAVGVPSMCLLYAGAAHFSAWGSPLTYGACEQLLLDNITLRGGCVSLRACPSNDEDVYTDLRLTNSRSTDCSRNGAFYIEGSQAVSYDAGGYANVVIDDLRLHGLNGPGYAEAPYTGSNFSSHGQGTAGLEVSNLVGFSTCDIRRIVHTGEVRGVWNHDSHCLRFDGTYCKTQRNVRYRIRDCTFRCDWVDADYRAGTGGGVMHVVYFHRGDAAYTDPDFILHNPGPNQLYCYEHEGFRPRFDFENCYFEQTCNDDLKYYVGHDLPSIASEPLLFVSNSSDFHLWDCHFSWHVPQTWIDGTSNHYPCASCNTAYASLYLHNCTYETNTPLARQTPLFGVLPDVNYVVDSQTLSYGPTKWMRPPPLALPLTLSDPGFELGEASWELDGQALRSLDFPRTDRYSIKLIGRHFHALGFPTWLDSTVTRTLFGVTPGRSFRFGCWYKCTSAISGIVRLVLRCDTGLGFVDVSLAVPGSLYAWRFLESSPIRAGATPPKIRFYVAAPACAKADPYDPGEPDDPDVSGAICIDDIALYYD